MRTAELSEALACISFQFIYGMGGWKLCREQAQQGYGEKHQHQNICIESRSQSQAKSRPSVLHVSDRDRRRESSVWGLSELNCRNIVGTFCRRPTYTPRIQLTFLRLIISESESSAVAEKGCGVRSCEP